MSATDSSSRSMVEIENPDLSGRFGAQSRRSEPLRPTGCNRPEPDIETGYESPFVNVSFREKIGRSAPLIGMVRNGMSEGVLTSTLVTR